MTIRWTDTVRREVLANGLTVLVQRDPDSPAVAVVSHVRAGFFDEPDHWAGISHVLEHMFFKGTPRRGVGAIARETKGAGGWLNAGTGYDHTAYYTVLPARSLSTALDIHADALRHATLDADELARELRVIIEEARRKRDTPGAVAHETMHGLLFDHHRIRRWRIGEEERLAAFTREDVAGYYQSRYLPSRTIVAVVGGVDEEGALAEARARFGGWSDAPAAVDPSPEEPPRREVRARTLRGDVTQADLVLGWRTVPPLHPDAPALEMAAAILSIGRAAWLPRALREPGIVLSVGASQFSPTEVGVFSIAADLEPDRLPAALGGIASVLDRLSRRGPSPEDLERARQLLRARWARRLESVESRASSLAQAEAIAGFQWLDQSAAAVLAVTAEEVAAAASRWLRPDSVTGVVYLPADRGADLTTDLLRRQFERPAPPPAARRLGGTHLTSLPGVDLLIRRKAGAGLVTLAVHRLRHGAEAPGQAGIGMLAARSAVRGAGGMNAGALAAAFERLGGPVAASVGPDSFGFATTVLAEHLDAAAGLLRQVVWHPDFASGTVEVERDTLAREAEQVADDMVRHPVQLAMGVAFGDAGYGVPVAGTPGSLVGLDVAALRTWHAAEMAGSRPVVVAVGDLDVERAAEVLADAFDGLSALGVERSRPTSRVAPLPGTSPRTAQRERAQTAFAMLFPGPSRRERGRVAAEVWAAAAGGLGGRLFEALRERRSLAYSVMAQAWQRHGAGALLTYIATSPEQEDEARGAMLEELDRFRHEGLTDAEFTRATAYLAGQAEVDRQTGGAVAGELLDLWLAGDPIEEFEEPRAPYERVTAAEVAEVLSNSLVAAARAEGVVRGGGPHRG